MPASNALRALDVHDYEEADLTPPCALCLGAVDCGRCLLCGMRVGEDLSAVYSVIANNRPHYIGRSLRRAFEAQTYLFAAGLLDARITVPRRLSYDFGGLNGSELAQLDAWDRRALPGLHTCIAPTRIGAGG